MTRFQELVQFLEFNRKYNIIIEPAQRSSIICERLFDVINTYNPTTIVKIGIGSGEILSSLLENTHCRIVVVEPSFCAITEFLKSSGKTPSQHLNIIQGDIHNFPIDYYKADMIASIDHLDLFDMSRCLDEFKRALNFDGILFFAGVILHNNDIEGIYDDLMRLICPLHTDYYLAEDFKTIMGLKDFTFIKSSTHSFERDLKTIFNFFEMYFGTNVIAQAKEFLNSHQKMFETLYALNKDNIIAEPYFMGVFKRNRPTVEQ